MESRNQSPGIKDYMNALVRPMCEQRYDGEAGMQTLRFLEQVLKDPNLRLLEIMRGIDCGMKRAHQGVVHSLPDMPPILLRFRLYAGSRAAAGVLCDWDRDRKRDHLAELIIDDLVVMLTAMVTAPVPENWRASLSMEAVGDPDNFGYTAMPADDA